jgi:hypothetical protein
VLDLTIMNMSLLCKWIWNLENTQGTWKTMLSRKYLANQVLSQEIRGPRGSHFWQSLLSVDDIFQQYRQRVMHEGEKALFWEDKWVNNTPRSIQFPRLYHLSFQKGFIVRKLKQEGWDIIKYRRTLFGETL